MPTYDWDSSFEASPADLDEAKYGATKIRDLKIAIRERMELEHNFQDGDSPSHKAGECAVLFEGNTANIANLASPVAGAIAWDTQLKTLKAYSTGNGWHQLDIIPSGSKMVFFQASAPVGWTIDANHNDKLLRVVSANGGGEGGNWTLAGVSIANHTVPAANVPGHTHTVQTRAGTPANGGTSFVVTQTTNASVDFDITYVGGGNELTLQHSITLANSWRPAYINIIVATKT